MIIIGLKVSWNISLPCPSLPAAYSISASDIEFIPKQSRDRSSKQRTQLPWLPLAPSPIAGQVLEMDTIPSISGSFVCEALVSQSLWAPFSQAAVHPLSEPCLLFPPLLCIKRVYSIDNPSRKFYTERVSATCHQLNYLFPFPFSCSFPLPPRHCKASHKNINCFLLATFQIVFVPCICDVHEVQHPSQVSQEEARILKTRYFFFISPNQNKIWRILSMPFSRTREKLYFWKASHSLHCLELQGQYSGVLLCAPACILCHALLIISLVEDWLAFCPRALPYRLGEPSAPQPQFQNSDCPEEKDPQARL